MLFGELMGEGFNNGDTTRDIEFSQFYLNTRLLIGAERVKWGSPVNVSLSRDTVSNEEFTVRYAFSGLYVKILDEKDAEGVRQFLELASDFVYAHINYQTHDEFPTYPEPCSPDRTACEEPTDPEDVEYPVTDRSALGLSTALKYEIENRGWGDAVELELLQDLSPSYTKVNARLMGFKRLSGELRYLRPYVSIDGVLDHDAMDPVSEWQGGLRVLGGISGRFDYSGGANP